MTMEEIDKVNTTRALNAAISKISPANIEQAALKHTKQIISMCLKMNGRDSEKYLYRCIPCLIRYLDLAVCQKQISITEQMHTIITQLRKSQTEL